MKSVALASLLVAAACGGTPRSNQPDRAPNAPVKAPERKPLGLELQVVAARGQVLARGTTGDWQPLAERASHAGVRELKVARQGAIVSLGHADAAGRLWLRAGTTVALGQDDAGVYVEVKAGRARLRRGGSALPAFVDAATGPVAVDGDYLLEARSDGATEVMPTGARPELADWALALERAEDGAGVGRMEAAPRTGSTTPEPLALRRVKVDVKTAGDLAVTEIEHVFFNPADENREGTFRFPVPDRAALTGLAMEIDGKLVEGEIVEREKAREVYESIVDEMRDPALLEWEEGNWFKLRVFPIEANGEKRVIIRYTSPLAHGAAGWEYDYALATQETPIGELTVTVDGAQVVHETQVAAGVDLAVAVGEDKVPPVMNEVRDDGTYTAVRIPGPHVAAPVARTGPRKVAVIVDTSRSALESKPLGLELVRTALLELGPHDKFLVLASDVAVTPHATDYVAADAASVDAAIKFLDAIEPDGASDLAAALAAAAAAKPTDVIYVGDGIPTWGDRTAAGLGAIADSIGAPVHAGLIGKGASTELWTDLAGRSGGRAAVLHRPIDAQRFAIGATHATEVPRLTDVRFTAPEGSTVYPAGASTIYAGDELVAFVHTPSGKPAPTTLAMTSSGGPVALDLSAPAKVDHVAQRWAAYRLAALDAAGAAREDIVAVSTQFGLMSRYTSLLVLENDEAYERYQIERKKQAEADRAAAAAANDPQITGGDLDTLGRRDPSLSPDEIQPGDPEIKIPAPADARSVVVSFPFGETKLAVWDAEANAWMVRFLIDKETPDGEYQVRITVTHADGRIEIMTLPYTVDTVPPAVELTVAKVATGYRIRAKQVAGKDADEVEVVLPDGAVMALAQTSWGKFEGVWQTTAQGGVVKLRVVVRDRALNQAVTELVVGGQ